MFNFYKKLINKLLCYFRIKDTRLDILDKIDFRNYPYLINSVFNMVLDKNLLVSEKAKIKIELYVSELNVKQLVTIDDCCRLQPYAVYDYHKVGPKYFEFKQFSINSPLDFNKLRQLHNWEVFVGLASMLPNGFIREEAVKILAESNSGSEIPFLFLRLNDNVWQIRELASKVISQKLSKKYLEIFAKYIEFIPRIKIKSWFKADKINVVEKLLDEIEILISSNLSKDLLKEIFRENNFHVRRIIARIAASSNINPLEAYEVIKSDNDHIVRIEYWKAIKNIISNDNCISIVKQLCVDSSPVLRCEALEYLVSKEIPFSKQFIHDRLFDKSSKVRWLARYFLSKNGLANENFREYCLSKIKENGVSAVLIDILGEVGNIKDVEFLLQILDGEQNSLTKRSFNAIAKISPEVLDRRVINFLTSNSPIMLSIVRRFICKHIQRFKFDELADIYFNSTNNRVKKAILIISNYTSKWGKMIFWLKALNDEEWIKVLINSYIERWDQLFNRTHCVAPSLSQINELNELMKIKFHLLKPSFVEFMNFTLCPLKDAK